MKEVNTFRFEVLGEFAGPLIVKEVPGGVTMHVNTHWVLPAAVTICTATPDAGKNGLKLIPNPVKLVEVLTCIVPKRTGTPEDKATSEPAAALVVVALSCEFANCALIAGNPEIEASLEINEWVKVPPFDSPFVVFKPQE